MQDIMWWTLCSAQDARQHRWLLKQKGHFDERMLKGKRSVRDVSHFHFLINNGKTPWISRFEASQPYISIHMATSCIMSQLSGAQVPPPSELGNTSKKETIWYHHCWPCPCPDTLHMGNMRRVLMGLFLYYINSGIVGLSLRIVISRGFQKFNGTPGVEFFILLGFTEPATHVIQACFYIR